MKYVALITVLFYKTETKQVSPDLFGFGREVVKCDTGRVKLKGKFYQTDSTIIVRKGTIMKTYYWYDIKK